MSKKSNNKSGMSMKTKWIITGILCVLAVLTVVVVAADGCFDFKPGSVQSNDKAVARKRSARRRQGYRKDRRNTHRSRYGRQRRHN